MKKKLIIGLVILVIITIISLFLIMNYQKEEKDNLYTIITDDQFKTLLNDGGTHYDTKYEVDLSKKIVTKYESYYIGFKGYKYENKVLYEKKLTNKEKNKIKELFEDIIDNKEIYSEDKEKTYMFYTFKFKDNEDILIYDKEVIDKIEQLLKEE